jgi:hypothetical protein
MALDYVVCSYVRWIRWYNAELVTNGLGYGERMGQTISISTQGVCYLLWITGKKTLGMHEVERVGILERGIVECGCATVEYLLNPWEHSIAQEGWRAVTGSMQGIKFWQRSVGAATVVTNRERCYGSENGV